MEEKRVVGDIIAQWRCPHLGGAIGLLRRPNKESWRGRRESRQEEPGEMEEEGWGKKLDDPAHQFLWKFSSLFLLQTFWKSEFLLHFHCCSSYKVVILLPWLICLSIKVCIPPEEEAFASKACENTLLFVCLAFVSKATENETSRENQQAAK